MRHTVAIEYRDIFRLFKEEYNEREVQTQEDGAPPPDPSPTLRLNYKAGGYRAEGGTYGGEDKVPCVHGSMLVDKEQVGNGDLHDSLADGTTKSTEEVAAHVVTVRADMSLPKHRAQLQRSTEQVQRPSSVFVYKRHEEYTANRKPCTRQCAPVVQLIGGEMQFGHEGAPGRRASLELYKGPKHEEADQTEVDGLAQLTPVEWIVRIGTGHGMEDDIRCGSGY